MRGKLSVAAATRGGALFALAFISLAAFLFADRAQAQGPGDGKHVLIYTGTTGFRHTDGINNGRPAVQTRLEALDFQVTWEDCNTFGTGAGQCRNADENPRVFTEQNLAQYDAIFFLNVSDYFSGTGGSPGQLFNASEEAAIIDFVQNGGGIAANHNATDMGAGQTTWNWWDANNANSVVGTTMPGHSANNLNATVMVQDQHHLSTRDLPDTFQVSDEHYNWARNVRGDHHVLANFDERTYNPGNNAMGQDHPITWCKVYDGDNVDDATGNPKPYDDGRTWITGIGHNGARYTENGGNNPFMDHLIGGIRWVAGEGKRSDCGGTVWSNFSRTVLVSNAHNPIAIDIAEDGKVYWTELGPTIGLNSQGYVKMHDPAGPPDNSTTVATIPTRADHGNSEDGVLGMSLEPGFDLSDPGKREIYVYYSPRNASWPDAGNEYTVGYNQISRFSVNEAGTAFEPGSERVILRVPKVKLAGTPSWCTGSNCSGNGPGHVGGASLVFDSDGSLYLGVGDDVAPGEGGHGNYPPLDYRAAEHRDARKTAANTNDLRGKILRIDPLEEIPAGTEPGVGQTYTAPAGNMFPAGTPETRPEIYAMGFRQPFTVHTDSANPGTVTVGEYCHDNSANAANRAPAGTCEWNLVSQPGFHGWPYCVGNNSAANTSFKWDYGSNASTGEQYDCSQAQIPSDLNYAPAGQTNPGPTNAGQATIPGPAKPATIWKKYTNEQPLADFGDLSAGGMQPITGPVYRYDADTAGPGAFPAYYDGSWLINNRGGDNGFWKEVRLREDTNQMLHVHNWLPYNAAGADNGSLNSLVIGTRFGPDGALYMARFPVTCCRNSGSIDNPVQIVKVEFNAQDECLSDTQPPNVSHQLQGQAHPHEPDTYVGSATLRLSANDVGCAGVDTVEYRLAGDSEWSAYDDGNRPVFEDEGDYEVEYRATDELGNSSPTQTTTFSVVDILDLEPPAVEATVSGEQTGEGDYLTLATLELEATDDFSFVESIERRVNGGQWVAAEFDGTSLTESVEVQFSSPGDYEVDYRATDVASNTSELETVAFRVVPEPGFRHAIEGISAGSQEFVTTTAGNHNPVTGLVDGDPTTRWAGGNPVTDAWAEFDLGSPQQVDTLRIAIFNGHQRSYPIQITAGDSPNPSQVVFTGTTETVPTNGDYFRVNFPATTARYFRITPTGNATPDNSAFFGGWEAQLIDSAGAPESCTGTYSDEFDGDSLAAKWLRHTRNGGTPESATQLSDGQLHMPVGRRELDGANPYSTGPVNFIGQDLAAMQDDLGSTWQVETEFTVSYDATSAPYGWPNVSLAVWQADNNFFRFSITRNSTSGALFAESSKDFPSTAEGARQSSSNNRTFRPAASTQAPLTVRMRLNRNGGDTVTGQYALFNPDTGAWEWTPAMLNANAGSDYRMGNGSDGSAGLVLNPIGQPRRDAPGTRIGILTGSNLNTADLNQVLPDADVDVEYLRVSPDPHAACSAIDTERPTTEHTLDPATPDGANGWYHVPVEVALAAADEDGGSGLERTEYRIDGGTWTRYDGAEGTGPFTVSEEGDHTVEYRSRDNAGNVEQAKSVEVNVDGAAPTTTATFDPPNPGNGGTYNVPVTLMLSANDAASGVDVTEYRVDGGDWEAYETASPPTFSDEGTFTVEYRSTDLAGNVEATKTVSFSVAPGACFPRYSDEFDGSSLDAGRWTFRHPTMPANGNGSASVSGGELLLPLGNFSLDQTRTGPVGLIGQAIPEGDFTLTAKISAPGLDSDVGGNSQSRYAQVGLKVFQTDGDWIKVAQTRNNDGNPAGSANSYFEMTSENGGTRTLGDRAGDAPPGTNLPTFWLRLTRTGNQVSAGWSRTDPDQGGTFTPLTFNTGATTTVNYGTVFAPGGGPVYVGPYGGNGSITARFDYLRVQPDQQTCGDTQAPTSSHALQPANPDGSAGWYRSPVQVTLSATDNEGGSGVDEIRYRTGEGSFETYGGPFTISADGLDTVEYYAVDNDGNEEESNSFEYKLDGAPPLTTASLSPPTPGPGGTYDQPVTVNLTASDGTSGVAGTEYRINGGAWTSYNPLAPPTVSDPQAHTIGFRSSDVAGNPETEKTVAFTIESAEGCAGTTHPVTAQSFTWDRNQVDAAVGDCVEWRWGIGTHDLFLVDSDVPLGQEAGVEETLSAVCSGGFCDNDPPVVREFPDAGSWDYYCKLHGGRGGGMSGKINVGGGAADTAPPTTSASLDPANPGAGGTYTGPVTVTLTGADNTGGSGVKETRFGVDGGAEQVYAGPFTVSGVGVHTVAYRSRDNAGNEEAAKQVQFTIAPAGGGPTPSSVGIDKPPKSELTMARFLRGGIEISARCGGVGEGTLQMTVKRGLAKRLGLGKKGTVLASSKVTCGRDGTLMTLLRPSAKVKRALAKYRGSLKATLELRMSGADGEIADRMKVKLKRSKARK